MVGRELGDYYRKRTIEPGETVLEVEGLRSRDGRLKPTTLSVRRGEIVGVAGLVGSGKAELGLALGGAIRERWQRARPSAGPPTSRSRAPRSRAGSASCPTTASGPRCCRRAAWPRTSPSRGSSQLTRAGVLDTRAERRRVRAAIERYNVDDRVARRAASRALGRQPAEGRPRAGVRPRNLEVLVLSEPTRGIDVGARSEIYRLMQEHAGAGRRDHRHLVRAPGAARDRRSHPRLLPRRGAGRVRRRRAGGGAGRPRGGLRSAPGGRGLTWPLRRRPRGARRGLRLPLDHRRTCS